MHSADMCLTHADYSLVDYSSVARVCVALQGYGV